MIPSRSRPILRLAVFLGGDDRNSPRDLPMVIRGSARLVMSFDDPPPVSARGGGGPHSQALTVPNFVPSGGLVALVPVRGDGMRNPHEYWGISSGANRAKLLIFRAIGT
jgi:hypothetical protein